MLENPDRCPLGRIVTIYVQLCNTRCIHLSGWHSICPHMCSVSRPVCDVISKLVALFSISGQHADGRSDSGQTRHDRIDGNPHDPLVHFGFIMMT